MSAPSSHISKLGLHPLAIAAICDHSTKVTFGATKQSKSNPALGLLFGNESVEKGVEIYDAIDLPNDSSDISLSFTDIETKNRLLVEVFPHYKLMGWYTTGSEVTSHHIAIHKSFLQYHPNPIFLLLNPSISSDVSQLPITLFTLTSDTSSASTSTSGGQQQGSEYFVDIPYSLATNQSEELSIDSITKQASSQLAGVSTIEINAHGTTTSLKVLEEHIDTVLHGLQHMNESGVIDHQVLRMANHLINMLMMVSEEGLQRDQTESDLTMMLAVSTKALAELHQLIDLTSLVCHEKSYI